MAVVIFKIISADYTPSFVLGQIRQPEHIYGSRHKPYDLTVLISLGVTYQW